MLIELSRMTKFLKQTCTWEKQLLDENGTPITDMYGDLSYESAITLKCRRERSLKDVLSNTGVISKSSTTYYLDELYEISIGDKIDGKVIIDFEEYTNEHGLTEGYMVVV